MTELEHRVLMILRSAGLKGEHGFKGSPFAEMLQETVPALAAKGLAVHKHPGDKERESASITRKGLDVSCGRAAA